MSVLVAERVERPASLFGRVPDAAPARAGASADARDAGLGGGLTLDDAIVGAWEGLAAQAVVACPMCGGALRPRGDDGDGDGRGGDCGDCGTTLT